MALEDRALRWQQFDAKIAWAGGPASLGAADTIAAGDYFAATTGAAANFSGSSSLTFSQSGSLVLNTNLIGTSAIIFDQSGTFVAGTLTGDAVFSGTSTMTFSQSGSFSAASIFNGISSTLFAQTGAFNSNAGFAGSSPITFGQSGSFVAGATSGNAVFVGTSSIVFGQTGNLIATVPDQQLIGTYAFRVSRQKQRLAKEAERMLQVEKMRMDEETTIMAVLEEFMRLAA
jgi:hypothetical protein